MGVGRGDGMGAALQEAIVDGGQLNPAGVRSSGRTPVARSSSRIWRDNSDGAMYIRRAAWPKWHSSASATKYLKCHQVVAFIILCAQFGTKSPRFKVSRAVAACPPLAASARDAAG